MTDYKMLARKTDQWLPIPTAMPEHCRFSLGTITVAEYSQLLRLAFDQADVVWTVPDNLVALPSVRDTKTGMLVAACSVIQPHFLHQVAVHPAAQRQGIGIAFIRQIAHLFELPYLVVQVDDTTTDHGLTFWKNNGFKEIGV